MKLTMLAKNRVILEHNGKHLRVEITGGTADAKSEWQVYFSPQARLYFQRELVFNKRKMTIAM